MPSTQLTSAYITEKIWLDEHHRVTESGELHTTFFAKAGKKIKGKSDGQKKCSYCQNLGHEKSECCKLKRDQEKKGKDGTAGKSSSSSPAS